MTRPTQALWQDYAFLTRELGKFAVRQDWEMFFTLLDQRELLQKLIDGTMDRDFTASGEGRALLNEIRTEEQAIAPKLRLVRNQAQYQQKINNAYDAFSSIPAGSLMDRGT